MARKTQNSSQSLSSVAAQTLNSSRVSCHSSPKSSKRNYEQSPQAPKTTTEHHTHQGTSSEDDASVDGHGGEDEGTDANAEMEVGKPAVIAPSVRATVEGSEQAGLLAETIEADAVVSALDQNQESSTANGLSIPLSLQSSHKPDDDDDDYAAVNDISDSSEDEADIEKFAEKDIIEEEKAHPTYSLSAWFGPEDGILGESETFFDHHPEADYQDSSMVSGDDVDYHSAWEGIPDTPMETPTSMSGLRTLPSLRHVHFEAQNSVHNLPSESKIFDDGPSEGDIAGKPSSLPSADDLDDGGSASGYETDDGETTDEEEPPVSACELYKAPHLLRRSSLSSLDTSPTSYVYTPSPSDEPFKLPSAPASQRRKGPKLGTFKTSPSRSYAMVNETGNALLIHHATRPSPSSTPRQSRVGSVTSNSAPQTPVISHATLALAPDLSETEFSDAAASQISADPILSAGLDFLSSAGFSSTTSHVPQTAFSSVQQSRIWVPQDSFPDISNLESQATGIHVQYDDPGQEDMDESAFEEMIVIPPDETSSEDVVSIVSPSSPASDAFAIGSTATSVQAAPKTSFSSASSTPDISLFNGVSVAAWRNSTNQRPQPRQPSIRLAHGLSLTGSAFNGSRPISQPPSPPKKRKLVEMPGRKTPPVLTSKRRITTSHR